MLPEFCRIIRVDAIFVAHFKREKLSPLPAVKARGKQRPSSPLSERRLLSARQAVHRLASQFLGTSTLDANAVRNSPLVLLLKFNSGHR